MSLKQPPPGSLVGCDSEEEEEEEEEAAAMWVEKSEFNASVWRTSYDWVWKTVNATCVAALVST